MDLRFSPEENAFRQELRSFFRSAVPESIRTKVMEDRHLSKEELVASHKALHAQFGRGTRRMDHFKRISARCSSWHWQSSLAVLERPRARAHMDFAPVSRLGLGAERMNRMDAIRH